MDVEQFLTAGEAEFDVIPHRETLDARHLARALNVPGRDIAKTMLVRAEDGARFIVAVLPAIRQIDFGKLAACLGCPVEPATEADLQDHCPGGEAGGLPPFGSQYGLQTVMDESLVEDELIIFPGKNRREAIRMKQRDFRHIEDPLVCDFVEG